MREGSWLLLAARAGLLLVAAGAAVAGLRRIAREGAGGVTAGRYVCPMHPEVTQTTPGECPLCGMALTLVAPATGAPAAGSAQPVVERPSYGTERVKHHVYSQELDLPAWIESPDVAVALLYVDELPALKPGERARFVPGESPSSPVAVRLTGEPPSPWDRSTVRLRLRFEEGDSGARASARPGALGRVVLERRRVDVVVVPSAAVLYRGDEPYVLVQDEGMLTRRPVATGRSFGGMTAVTSGVTVRETVVSTNAFFMDAERRLRSARPTDEPPP